MAVLEALLAAGPWAESSSQFALTDPTELERLNEHYSCHPRAVRVDLQGCPGEMFVSPR